MSRADGDPTQGGAGEAGDAPEATPTALRVLGVDLGLKRTGLALSDPLGISVRALENLVPGSRAEDVEHLASLCREHEVQAVVIGWPVLPRSGDEGAWARRVRGFAEALKGRLVGDDEARVRACAVHLVNEVGSSQEAARRLVQSGVKRSQRKAALDSEAARVLVEAFLAGDRGQLVDPPARE